MHVRERLDAVQTRLHSTEKELDAARRAAKKANQDFGEVKQKRFELFNTAFNHISDQIGPVYKELTRTTAFPLGGQA